MRFTRGEHFDRSITSVVLHDPAYTMAMIRHGEHDQPQEVVDEAARLVAEFDAAPFRIRCEGENCTNNATRAVLYGDNRDPQWWCDDCDPYPTGATAGKVHVVKTYRDAVTHVAVYQDRGYGPPSRDEYAYLISAMAAAKAIGA